MSNTIPMCVKHTLKDLRVRAGLSQAEAAQALDITDVTLRKWESDSSILTFRDMNRVSDMYGLPIDYIFFGPNNAFSEKEA